MPVAASVFSTAKSFLGSMASTLADTGAPFIALTVMLLQVLTTWLLVSTSPALLRTIPEPEASLPLGAPLGTPSGTPLGAAGGLSATAAGAQTNAATRLVIASFGSAMSLFFQSSSSAFEPT